jgi:hypothetical protein
VLGLVSDENFTGDNVRGLRRRLTALELVRVQDVGLAAANDPAILAWAADQGRIVLTHDRSTLPGFAYERVQTGQPMPGVFVVSDQMPIGQAVDELLLAIQCLSSQECENLVRFFPL